MTVLVDSGSTHNFVQTRVAKLWKLEIEPTNNLNVTIGDGSELHCQGKSNRVPLKLGNVVFKIDLFILPIYGADIVLGAHWLAKLGTVTFNYRSLWMAFQHQGKQITLQGIQGQGQFSLIGLGDLQKAARYYHLTTCFQLEVRRVGDKDTDDTPQKARTQKEIKGTGEEPGREEMAVSQTGKELRALLDKFKTIFDQPHSLPPKREADHKIPSNHRSCAD